MNNGEHGWECLDTDPIVVPITRWDSSSIDSLRDAALEALKDGTIDALFAAYSSRQRMKWMIEGMNVTLIEIMESPNPKAAVKQLAFVGGLNISLGKSGPQLAKECGMSKQAFFQAVERLKQKPPGIKRPNERTEEAKQNMSKRNSRRGK